VLFRSGAETDDLDPDLHRELLNQYPDGVDSQGADALRFTLAIYAAQGRDIKLDISRVEGYRAFLNKLWNAARFALMNLEDFEIESVEGHPSESDALTMVDKWILHRLREVTSETTAALEEYKFNEYAQTLYHFVWHELCDWYIEFVKPALYDESADGAARRQATQATLLHAVETSLRLMHPASPFITEDIWQALPRRAESADALISAPWPRPDDTGGDFEEAAAGVDYLISTISQIRAIRGETRVKPSVQIEKVFLRAPDADVEAHLKRGADYIAKLAKIDELAFVTPGEELAVENAAAAVTEGIEIRIPLAGLIDVEEERARLQKELARCEEDIEFVSRKLSNEGFVNKAPEHIVQTERDKLEAYQDEKKTLLASLEELDNL